MNEIKFLVLTSITFMHISTSMYLTKVMRLNVHR
jgi:hypothetical protein